MSERDTSQAVHSPADSTPGDKTWIAVFVFCFIGLMVDGMDLMFLAYSLSSVKAEFGLTELEAGLLGSFSLVGMAAGGILGGWASDRFGRVRTLIWTIVVFSVGTAMLGLVHSYAQFAFVRFIASLGMGAEYVVANTLMAEYVPTKHRTTALGTLQAGWSVGYVAATLLSGLIIPVWGWRYLFYIAIIPVVMVLFIQRMVPEPPSWRNRMQQRATSPVPGAGVPVKTQGAWKQIFGNAQNKKLFLLWSVTAGCLQFGYYGVNNWLPRYIEKEMNVSFKSMTGYLLGTYLAMILGKIASGYMADKVGRRPVYAFGGIATALFIPIIVLCHDQGNILYLLFIFGFLYGVPYGVGATYMTESFASEVRGSAVGGAYNIGRVGAAIAPAAIGFMATQASIGAGFLLMGGAYFLCGILPALFIKEKIYDPQNQ